MSIQRILSADKSHLFLTICFMFLGATILLLNGIGLHISLTDGGVISWQGIIMSCIGLIIGVGYLLSPLLGRISGLMGLLGTFAFLATSFYYNSDIPAAFNSALVMGMVLYLMPGLLLFWLGRPLPHSAVHSNRGSLRF